MQRSISVHGRSVVFIAAMAVVLEHPARRALADFRNALPPPAPCTQTETLGHPWPPWRVADACLAEGRAPYIFRKRTPTLACTGRPVSNRGDAKATCEVPLRQRNVRELRLGTISTRIRDGHWQLHFRGDELKIGTRRGKVNTYRVNLTDYCPEFIPVLEEFLREYRPRLPGPATSPHLFLTYRGNPFTQRSLDGELSSAVVRRTGQRFYPHLIRTIWATEYLEKTQDFATAARCWAIPWGR